MSTNPAKGLLAIVAVCAMAAPAAAQVNPAQILAFKPKSEDVQYTTPTPDKVAGCNVEVIKTPGGGTGYHLTDGNKQTLRKFLDTDGDGRVDTWCYYKDGAEVYRESISAATKKYTFRWVGAGGMKWAIGAVDGGGKAVVETWKTISAEEAANEAFRALATGDVERMKVLMITPQELQGLGLPAVDAQKILSQVQAAATTMKKVIGNNPTISTATFSRLENAQPGTFLPDMTGGTQEVVKITRGLILFENPNAAKKHDFIMSQEMIQVGSVWRLTDVPSGDVPVPPIDSEVQKLQNKLAEVDKMDQSKGKIGAWVRARVPVLQELARRAPDNEKDVYHRQIFDNLSLAIMDNDSALMTALKQHRERLAAIDPKGPMVPYGTYREITSEWQPLLMKEQGRKYLEVEAKYHEALAKFVNDYPQSEDAPYAIITIANGADLAGRDDEAKKWYGQLVKTFPGSPNAARAAGAIERIDSVGKAYKLQASTLTGQPYSHAPGKVTVAYYWFSQGGQAVGDFATLKKLQTTFPKDLDIVTVSLDDNPADAAKFVQQAGLNVPHLFEAGKDGGMSSRLAMQYGIFGLPHVFLIDRDGKVVSYRLQVAALEDEITKLTKK